MPEEELIFQLLEEERKSRTRRIAEEKRITTEDCLVIGVLRLNKEIDGLYERIDDTNKRIDGTNRRIEEMDNRMNRRIDSLFKWSVGLILGMWATMVTMLTPVLLKLVGMI